MPAHHRGSWGAPPVDPGADRWSWKRRVGKQGMKWFKGTPMGNKLHANGTCCRGEERRVGAHGQRHAPPSGIWLAASYVASALTSCQAAASVGVGWIARRSVEAAEVDVHCSNNTLRFDQ